MNREEKYYGNSIYDTLDRINKTISEHDIYNDTKARNIFIQQINYLESILYPKIIRRKYNTNNEEDTIEACFNRLRKIMIICEQEGLIKMKSMVEYADDFEIPEDN